ncbi:MAG: hypothetical protein HOM44_19440 [Gammaproteobacteria bacterium]|jgi:hypothetical protein|nr:hypothetical protein [Gammaproteobacteria bacterium]MBT5726175.1 hypothetical protein [Gammaproteobacteria bacterium]MBT7880807.1 hypothetical protein [Gammaproteobacteria bacterium]
MKDSISIEYSILKDSGELLTFDVEIDDQNESKPPDLITSENEKWARLDNHQCQHCPLTPSEKFHCPVAQRITWVVDSVQHAMSTEVVECKVTTPERVFSSRLPMQRAIYSLLGLLMATSGCPHLGFLKPMARYHLPFSTAEETIVRTSSFYLLAQYFKENSGGEADYSLAHLGTLYEEVSKVNEGIIKRVHSRSASGDADKNSIIILNSFAQILSLDEKVGLNSVAKSFI